MSEQSGFRNNGTKTARLRKSNDGDDHMKEKDDNIAQENYSRFVEVMHQCVQVYIDRRLQ